MAFDKFGRQVKRSYYSYGFCVKVTFVAIFGLCFVFIWSVFSSSSSSVISQRSTFDDIAEPAASNGKFTNTRILPHKDTGKDRQNTGINAHKPDLEVKGKINVSTSIPAGENHSGNEKKIEFPKDVMEIKNGSAGSETVEVEKNENQQKDDNNKEEEEEDGSDKDVKADEELDGDGDVNGDGEPVAIESVDQEEEEEEDDESKTKLNKKKKKLGPLFDQRAHYTWKLCNTRSKHNYIPCIDIESSSGKLQIYRHHERSCPKSSPPMCLVPLPRQGYNTPVSWPESKSKIVYKNVEHPKLTDFIKKHKWMILSSGEEYLTFPQDQFELKGGIQHYLESIEEMVPDIEWGKNIRLVLDIGCTDSSFTSSLLDKDVFTLTLGLKDDLVDLAQVALERGFPAIVSPFGNRKLPFPSGVFDAIHCGECEILWHSNGGKLLLEMNRILRPAGYFILSTRHDGIEEDKGMSSLTASISWNILAHKADEDSELGVKIYQKPVSNDIYELRRKKIPLMCKENDNPDVVWYKPLQNCLHVLPSAIEERGTEWPEEWPKRLETFPEWTNNKDKLIADSEHWKAIVNNSYITGLGIDWLKVRNVMDMKAINGGFAAALSKRNVWVMNVVPVHAPDTLPIIFERGLVGIYHDWCESFGSYPRSYDLLHADHLFSRLKNRCKQPVAIVVEMDRILRPGGWLILRDKVEILTPLEGILRSLHWEIHTTYHQDKEGIVCAQKTVWRP
ncbi:probable methyltransferase PMT28 [Impatiens glandulifera]|uniref:probable methyltransferase PMT28 n=1 Tax=Impatiens glandulifera TaxID=253017 RepID=UPI001FB11361|nr:probable methyltransferase PMT28 [Impatiens glandulifera]